MNDYENPYAATESTETPRKERSHLGYIGIVAVLWLIAGIGFFSMRFYRPLLILCVPFIIPGVILGGDEAQERFGYWGEPFLYWLLSLPCALLYAWLIHRGAIAWAERSR